MELQLNKMIYNSTLKDYEKNMYFLYPIHSTLCYIFHDKPKQ